MADMRASKARARTGVWVRIPPRPLNCDTSDGDSFMVELVITPSGRLALVDAAGGIARRHDGQNWTPMQRFDPGETSGGPPDLRFWRGEIVVGNKDAVEQMCALRGVIHG